MIELAFRWTLWLKESYCMQITLRGFCHEVISMRWSIWSDKHQVITKLLLIWPCLPFSTCFPPSSQREILKTPRIVASYSFVERVCARIWIEFLTWGQTQNLNTSQPQPVQHHRVLPHMRLSQSWDDIRSARITSNFEYCILFQKLCEIPIPIHSALVDAKLESCFTAMRVRNSFLPLWKLVENLADSGEQSLRVRSTVSPLYGMCKLLTSLFSLWCSDRALRLIPTWCFYPLQSRNRKQLIEFGSYRLVATLGPKSVLKTVTRKAIIGVNVPKACETIIQPEAPMALRLQSNLL